MPVLEWQRIWILKDEKEYEYKELFNNDTTKSEDCDFITTNINIFLDLG